MLQYLVRRLVSTIPALLAVSFIVFSFVHLLPGDPARLIAGNDATETDVALVRQDLGLDRPFIVQYGHFLGSLARLDLGRSLRTKRPVAEEIGDRFMPTFLLTLYSMIWAVLTGLALGIWSAVRRGKWQDFLGMGTAVSGMSFPGFWLGLMLIEVFAVKLRLVPTSGYGTPAHFILPSITLGVGVAAVMARFTRSAFIDVLKEDFVRTARAKGLRERLVIGKHALRNALIPIITMVGLQFGFLLGGSIVVETVFAWPGLGRLLIDAVAFRDYTVIQVEILLFSLEFIAINIVIDMLYALVNPAIRLK